MGQKSRIMNQLKLLLKSPSSSDKAVSKMSMQIVEKIHNAELNVKKKKKKKKRKSRKKRKLELRCKVDDMKEEEKAECEKASDIDDTPASANPVDSSDNSVLRTLLRGPRYFDAPDSSWGTCYNCGEEGHTAFNCTAPRRLKPCFVCGSLDHNAKNCVKGKDCYFCKKGGHIAKDCPEKNRVIHIAKMCLKCGDAGHDMFSCRNSYSTDNLKEIQCYVCRKFGHLCCVEYTDSGPSELSCYRCGQLGHTGLACIGFRTETPCATETPGAGSLSSCYKCGEDGHFACECTSSTKVGKRNREHSTPKKNRYKENGNEVRSVPNDLGKASKKKKFHHDDNFTSASKSKHKGGLGTEVLGDFQEYGGWYGSSSRSNHRGGWGTEDRGDFQDQEYRGWYGSSSISQHIGGWEIEHPGGFQEYDGWYGSSSRSSHIGGWGIEHPGHFQDYGGWYGSSSRSQHRGGWRSTEDPGDFPEYGGWYGSSSRSIHRGGWMTGDPRCFHESGYKPNCWISPATPKKSLNYNYASSATKTALPHNISNSGSYGSSKYHQRRLPSPHIGYKSSDPTRRDHGWN